MEEDIKILEKIMKRWNFGTREIEAIENLIKGYREIEKYRIGWCNKGEECERLKNKLLDTMKGTKIIKEKTPQYIKENYIPKSKIKEKIEELEHEKFKRTYLGFFPKNNCENRILLAKIQVLQELIEDK